MKRVYEMNKNQRENMSEGTEKDMPLWQILFGIFCILGISGLFVYGSVKAANDYTNITLPALHASCTRIGGIYLEHVWDNGAKVISCGINGSIQKFKTFDDGKTVWNVD